MTARWRTLARALTPLALAALVAGLSRVLPVRVQTSLYDLVGDVAAKVPASVRNRSNDRASVVASAATETAALAAADALVAALPAGFCAAVRHRDDGAAFAETLAFYAANGAGVVSAADAERLRTAEGRAKIARAAVRKHFASPVTLFTPVQDPFGLLSGFAASLPAAVMGWTPRKDGALVAELDGETHVLVSFALPSAAAGDVDALERFASGLRAAMRAAARDGVRFAAAGVPLHTAATASRCRREIGWLGAFSALVVACLVLWAFRTWKAFGWFALSLANAGLAGFAALVLFSPSFHLLAIVFGTTVLGLVVDYSFHWLLRPEADVRATRRNLAVSFATTEAGLVPLACASLPALAQAAVFLGAGLAAALATVLFLYPREWRPAGRTGGGPAAPAPRRRVARIALVAAAAAMAAWLPRARFETPLTALYRPPAELAAAEAQFARLGGADAESGFLVTAGKPGTPLDDLLAAEARALGGVDGAARLSRFLPPLAERRENWERVRLLYAEQGETLRRALNLPSLPPPAEPPPWDAATLPRALAGNFFADGALVASNVPREAERAFRRVDGADSPETLFWRPADLADALAGWERSAIRLFAAAAVATFALLLLFLRGRAVRVFAPAALALLAVAAALAARGEPVNLFHVLAGFLLLGMGVDYAVFLHESRGRAATGALCALLTSMAGFGALAFASFPVVAAFGFVLGLGLPVAFFAAWATAPCASAP
ncbi:MAG: hypothetical protein MJ138_02530, partial [Kiritimatiellae bacterium]|nr:hypothetical protein [Kiritimatiellia bacterium]